MKKTHQKDYPIFILTPQEGNKQHLFYIKHSLSLYLDYISHRAISAQEKAVSYLKQRAFSSKGMEGEMINSQKQRKETVVNTFERCLFKFISTN